MTVFDFFEAEELPAPALSTTDAREIAATHFGLDATVVPLGSQQDANFLLESRSGDALGVLKVANTAFSRLELEAQDAAARFVVSADPRVRTAVNLELPSTEPITEITTGDGILFARIIQFLPGGTMSGTEYLSPARIAGLGSLAGRAASALAHFTHPGVDRVLQWDLQHADRTIELLAPYVSDSGLRNRIQSAAESAWSTVAELAGELPRQVIHCDITDDNVVCGTGFDRIPDGIIDFGDLTSSWAVGELAVALSSVLRHEGGEPAATLPAVTAFHRERPLSAAEVAALWPLLVLRAATVVVSGAQQAVIDTENTYVTDALELEWRIFERATEIPAAVMTELFTHHLGLPSRARPAISTSTMFPGLNSAALARLDFSTVSDSLDGGRWLQPDCEERLASEAIANGAAGAVSTFGQPRLTRSAALSAESPATVGTGIDLWPAAECAVVAPLAAVVEHVSTQELSIISAAGRISVRGDNLTPSASVRVGQPVDAGTDLATATPGRLWLQVTAGSHTAIPDFVRPEYAAGWLALGRDPHMLLGSTSRDPVAEDSASLLQRRRTSFANVQEQYYLDPPRIERGWREFLLDTEGRSYLDMVNNVAVVGHGHPELADAAARQWRRLNTNSRFNYAAVVEFSERLAATLPDPLDTVFLVNSGSEAVDLALRLAIATTGRPDIVAVTEAYHGWTYATDAVSTSLADNPNALATRPEWVHVVPSPNSYRGVHRGAEAARYAPEAVSIIENFAAQGRPPAAFICEPFYGNAGGVQLPDGYLSAVYQAVRAAGGLAIADEVQVGYGRLGSWFWGFQQQGVLPDIVTVAKAMGNGQPLGAVITTRAIAEAYRTQGYFFSSAGGSPVSSVVGLTVLELIEREGLQHNALTVGNHLRERLNHLAGRHPLIGAIHGSGLYMGVELVRDRQTLEPAVEETAAICERIRELGVIVQPTGDRMCVLKMKPPMCLTLESADFFVDALDRVLSTGW